MKTLALLIIAGILSAASYSASATEVDCVYDSKAQRYICTKPTTSPAPDDKPKPPAPKPKPQP